MPRLSADLLELHEVAGRDDHVRVERRGQPVHRVKRVGMVVGGGEVVARGASGAGVGVDIAPDDASVRDESLNDAWSRAERLGCHGRVPAGLIESEPDARGGRRCGHASNPPEQNAHAACSPPLSVRADCDHGTMDWATLGATAVSAAAVVTTGVVAVHANRARSRDEAANRAHSLVLLHEEFERRSVESRLDRLVAVYVDALEMLHELGSALRSTCSEPDHAVLSFESHTRKVALLRARLTASGSDASRNAFEECMRAVARSTRLAARVHASAQRGDARDEQEEQAEMASLVEDWRVAHSGFVRIVRTEIGPQDRATA